MGNKVSIILTRESRVLHQVELLPPLLLAYPDRAGLPLLGRGGQGEEPFKILFIIFFTREIEVFLFVYLDL